jgi:hypothetical protein
VSCGELIAARLRRLLDRAGVGRKHDLSERRGGRRRANDNGAARRLRDDRALDGGEFVPPPR